MDIIYKKNNKIYRKIKNIEDAQKIIDVFQSLNLFNGDIVKTKIHSMENSTLEHELIKPIIHSGEYTTSMLYDVTRCALDLALSLVDKKLYSYDLLPHNYTYCNGKWLLYDFESFRFQPQKIKTQIRGMFKIVFSSLELLKLLDRKAIKHCFLNRVNHFYLLKMINHKNWFLWCIRQYYCLLLHKLGLNKKTYTQLNYYFKKYEKKYSREYYQPIISTENQKLYEYIDDILDKNNITSVFSIGKNSANWSLLSKNKSKKFIYLDDYNECDKFYNYIHNNNHNLISTAVIYPFMQDKEINKNFAYRGLYDYFAKERFNSEAVVILNNDELYTNKTFDTENFCKNIMEFSTQLCIHSFDINTEVDLAKQIQLEMQKYYNYITIIEHNNHLILIAKDKKQPLRDYSNLKQYTNNNRGEESKAQSLEIIEILKNTTRL